MAQTFIPITPVEYNPTDADQWDDIDCSSSVPSGATGVVLHIVAETATAYSFGIRKNGSTDDRHNDFYPLTHQWAAIGVDANRIFEAYVENNVVNFSIYVVGYTLSGVTFKTNGDDKTLEANDAWNDIDCSAEAPGAIGLIFECSSDGNKNVGFRQNGSSDDRHQNVSKRGWATVGCDSSQICEGYTNDYTTMSFFLIGYITEGAAFNTNATDLSLTSTGSWQDLSALPSQATMGLIEVHGGLVAYGLRKNTSSEDIHQNARRHNWGYVECDASRKLEGYISSTETGFFLIGIAEATEKTSSETGSGAESSTPAFLSRDEGHSQDSFSAKIESPTKGGGMKIWI